MGPSGSIAARMLARKNNLQASINSESKRDYSQEVVRVTGSKETRKLTNRGDGGITSSRN